MKKINAQLALEAELAKCQGKTPSLLLHVCCAPCSSYVLEYLAEYFDITVFFYNPNITDPAEYEKRAAEERRLIPLLKREHRIDYAAGDYDPERFLAMAQGLENLPEGGARCFGCYRLRLEATAAYMAAHPGQFDYFATTLTVSPHKNAAKLNEIGEELAAKYDVRYLPSDFKKKGGYLRSIELSRQYDLYRQDFCGCEFSRRLKHGDD
ncbi:MAG: epoxyqueuosine reductase QueH [Clostridia bacterium]|nr:epoxyqueuosine reductase QueH [Clostridia bacterium]